MTTASPAPGDKLGSYQVVALLGKGGMGEVYRARDAKLNRDVAIKVLPPALANDADYRARFEREAQVLAALNHPNIAAIYGLEGNAIVMELVEGETLRTPLPMAEALPVARQIAEALEAAHEKGIIHRDLKPGNVKVTPEGVVKVLDFGLAKTSREDDATTSADSPTLTNRATEAGLILGTAAYMSPEQAAGKAVDRRADIWAFGVVLYELLTGQRLFEGETVAETLADVMRKEIDLGKLPPPDAAGDSRVDPAVPRPESEEPAARYRRGADRDRQRGVAACCFEAFAFTLALGRAAVFALVSAALTFVQFTAKPPEPPLRSFSFTPKDVPTDASIRRAAISPDGRHVAYVAESKLWVRPLAAEQARALEGTDGARGPFWSPDSAQIGFASGGELKKVSLNGGLPFSLTKHDGQFRGGAWSPDGRTILVSRFGQGLAEIPAGGGVLKVVPPPSGDTYYSPVFLPFPSRKRLVVAGKGDFISQILELIDLDAGKSETLRARGAYPAWSPGGYLLYQTDARTPGLLALKLSPATGKAEGEPVPVLNAGSDFSASADGTLLWVDSAIALRRLTWRDRSGKKLADAGLPSANNLGWVALSPDGTQAAYAAE